MINLKQRGFMKMLVVSTTSIACAVTSYAVKVAEKPTRPNILYIMADDHAPHAIGAYGERLAVLNPTPTIDRLAREGIRLNKVFAANSLCMPSRATIFSGQHSHVNGIRIISHFNRRTKQPSMQAAILPEKQALSQVIQKAGYETAVVGKWHLVAEPEGFDYYNVLPAQGKYNNPVLKEKGAEPWQIGKLGGREYMGHSSDVITDQAMEWLKNRPSEKTKPFFLMLQYKAPHDMFVHAARYDSLYEDVEIPEPKSLYERGTHGPIGREQYSSSIGPRAKRNLVGAFGIKKKYPDATDRELTHYTYQEYLKRYLRCVKGIDDNIARVLKHLEETGALDNTIIVYTSDQGMNLGEHDYQDKRWIYEESIKMPFIVRYPRICKAGTTSDAMISNVDFAPTLIDLAGATIPDDMQGRSFVPILKGSTPTDWPKQIYYRYWMHLAHAHNVPAHLGIRTERYKLAFFYGLPFNLTEKRYRNQPTTPHWELYDLQKDPKEMNNVINNPDYAETLKTLKAQLKQLRKDVRDTDEAYPEMQEVIRKHW